MILETKQVLLREHVHLLNRRSRNADDHLEQTLTSMIHLSRLTGENTNFLYAAIPQNDKQSSYKTQWQHKEIVYRPFFP